MNAGAQKSARERSAEVAEGRAWARAWREANPSRFDALYSPAVDHKQATPWGII